MEKKVCKVIVIGAGSRGQGYTDIMSKVPDLFKVVGVAEPLDDRREYIKEKHGVADEHCFDTWEKILDIPKFADVAIIATMDRMHTEPALKALELGYDLLLEKPVAPTPEECAQIVKKAKECGRKILVCHVLRYTPFFRTVKKLIKDGVIGDVVNVEHIEAVGHTHQSHSFVRGNWGNEDRSSFMLLQKCCHDLDILQWLLDKDCKKIQSFGSTMHFKRANAPEGSPEYCIDGCPAGETCLYNAMKLYYEAKGNHWFRCAATLKPSGKDTDEVVLDALRNTQYGKCVYKCDNNVVDHQTVNMEFEDGALISLTMSAFATGGRRIRIMGTKGELVANMNKPANQAFELFTFAAGIGAGAGKREVLDIDYSNIGDSITGGHGGGDDGIIIDLYKYIMEGYESPDLSEISISAKNHMLAFAAEKARLTNTVVDVEDFINGYINK